MRIPWSGREPVGKADAWPDLSLPAGVTWASLDNETWGQEETLSGPGPKLWPAQLGEQMDISPPRSHLGAPHLILGGDRDIPGYNRSENPRKEDGRCHKRADEALRTA